MFGADISADETSDIALVGYLDVYLTGVVDMIDIVDEPTTLEFDHLGEPGNLIHGNGIVSMINLDSDTYLLATTPNLKSI